MHFKIPVIVVYHNATTAHIITNKTVEKAKECALQIYGEGNDAVTVVDDFNFVEVKIDGNRLLFKAETGDEEWAWLEAEKVKD